MKPRPLPPAVVAAVERAQGRFRHLVSIPKAPRPKLNGLETSYLAWLELRKRAGELSWIGEHQSMSFLIAMGKKKARYRPDFPVRTAAGALELHEVKGFWREAGRLRIKVAAGAYPWKFIAITEVDGRWKVEEF